MNVYALDSNIISFFLKENAVVINNIEKALSENHKIIITPIAYYEVKRGLLLINAKKQLKRFLEFCDFFQIGELSNNFLDEAIKIYIKERKEKRNTEDADILIAAFCICNEYILVTDNTRHFRNIENLQIINWSDSK